MDFLTGMAYWGILILVLANAILVSRMNVSVRDAVNTDNALTKLFNPHFTPGRRTINVPC